MTAPWWFRPLGRLVAIGCGLRRWADRLRHVDPQAILTAMAPQFVLAGA